MSYPLPTDRAVVVVYDPDGTIRQCVQCRYVDMALQTQAWAGHSYLDITAAKLMPLQVLASYTVQNGALAPNPPQSQVQA